MRDLVYHATAIALGAAVLAVGTFGLNSILDDQRDPPAEVIPLKVTMIDLDDSLSMLRLSAGKALNGNLEPEWAYSLSSVCSQPDAINATFSGAVVIPAKQDSEDLTSTEVQANSKLYMQALEQFKRSTCHTSESVSKSVYLLSESKETYSSLSDLGIYPTKIAVPVEVSLRGESARWFDPRF